MKKYDLIIFDFDGTLVDTAGDIRFCANEILRQNGKPLQDVEAVKKAVGRGVHELLKDLGWVGTPAELDQAVLKFKELYRENPVRHSDAYPGVREIFDGPLKNVKKAIVTNKPQDITLQILDRLKMSHYFLKVIGMGAGYPFKPDPTGTYDTMKELGVSKAQTVFIGDSWVDAETCRKAQIDFGWVNYGYDDLEGRKATMTFSSAKEWAALV